MRYNLSITREVAQGWTVTGSYVASLGRRTLSSEDLATPLNIRDPQSGVDYFTAAKQLTGLIRAKTPTARTNGVDSPMSPFRDPRFPRPDPTPCPPPGATAKIVKKARTDDGGSGVPVGLK